MSFFRDFINQFIFCVFQTVIVHENRELIQWSIFGKQKPLNNGKLITLEKQNLADHLFQNIMILV